MPSAVTTAPKPNRTWLRRGVTWLFFGCIIVFLVLYLRSIDVQKLSHISVNWQLVGIGSLVGLAFRYLGVIVWRTIIRDLGTKQLPGFLPMADVYAKAWMGRYIPGTVTWIAGKVYMASRFGISKSRLAVASLLEGGVQVAAITFVSFLLLGFDPRLNVLSRSAKLLLLALGFAVLIVLIPAVFNRLFRAAYHLFKRSQPDDQLRINGKAVVRSFMLYCLGAFLSGASCYFVVLALVPGLSLDSYWYIVGSFGLATVAGMAAPFAPSGIGIRDGIQLVLLAAIMPKEVALMATIFIRLWSVAVDIIFFAIARGLQHFRGSASVPGAGHDVSPHA